MVRHAALIGLLPRVTQLAHSVLLLAATQGLGHQCLSPNGQVFTDLVGAPALPALQLARCAQGVLGCGVKFVANVRAMFFQGSAHRIGCTYAGFAMAFGQFML